MTTARRSTVSVSAISVKVRFPLYVLSDLGTLTRLYRQL
jgi:hypothetical protein